MSNKFLTSLAFFSCSSSLLFSSNANNASTLNNAIISANIGASTTINFLNDISLSGFGLPMLRPLNTNPNFTSAGQGIVVEGNFHTLNGAGAFHGFFVRGGNVQINNLTFSNTLARGGSGGSDLQGGSGGGGGGLGGALYVSSGSVVIMFNPQFLTSQAIGGAGGGKLSGLAGAGGGGFIGSGGDNPISGGSGGGGALFAGGTTDGSGGAAGGGGTGAPGSPNNSGDGGNGGGDFGGSPGGNGGNIGITGNPGFPGNSGTGGGGGGQGATNGGGSGGTGGFGGGGGGGGDGNTAGGPGVAGGSFGGGGGGGSTTGTNGGTGGIGGFAGGGGGAGRGTFGQNGAAGGFAGGGGGAGGFISSGAGVGGPGGFGGGFGGNSGLLDGGFGGGGAGFGGAIFLEPGAILQIINSALFQGNTVQPGPSGGSGAGNGAASGADIFMMSGSTINFNAANDITIPNPIGGDQGAGGGDTTVGGLTKTGAGLLTLEGPKTYTYTGTTTVDLQGRLRIEASVVTDVNVGPTGTLLGSFSILRNSAGTNNGNLTNAGVLAPGIVDLAGTFQQLSTGTFILSPVNTTELSQLTVGNAILDGTLQINIPEGSDFSLTQPFPFLIAINNITGVFAKVIAPSFLNANLIYAQRSVTLAFGPIVTSTSPAVTIPTIALAGQNSFTNITSTQVSNLNQRMITAISGIGGAGGVGAAAESAPPSTPQTPTSTPFRTLSPAGTRTTPTTPETRQPSPTQKRGDFRNVKSQHQIFRSKELDLISANMMQAQEKQYQLAEGFQEPGGDQICGYPAHFYFGPQGILGEAGGVDFWELGAIVGFDYAFYDIGLGIGIISNYSHYEGKEFKMDQIQGNFYLTYVPPCAYHWAFYTIDGGGYDWFSFHSKTGFPSNPITVKADPNGFQYQFLLGVQYTFDYCNVCCFPENFRISPFFNVDYQRFFLEGYRQHGGGTFDLKFRHFDIDAFYTELGTHVNYTWQRNTLTWTTDLLFSWKRVFLAHEKSLHTQTAFGAFSSTVLVPGLGRNIIDAGIDVMGVWCDRFGLEGNYFFEWNKAYHTHNFALLFNFYF